jgi:hypothetical protein
MDSRAAIGARCTGAEGFDRWATKRKEEQMARILKALGLTLAAMFAVGAVATSSASAIGPEFTSFDTEKNEHRSGNLIGVGNKTRIPRLPRQLEDK